MWLITLAAQISSVEFLNFNNFLQFLKLKKLFITLTLFIFFEYLATLEDGSKPKEQPNKSTYPLNHTYTTESGHVMEYDDTPGGERIHQYHKRGTFYEINQMDQE